MGNLQEEFNYFEKNKESLIDKYQGKYIVIKNNEVLGAYNDTLSAINKTRETEALGTFLVQFCDSASANSKQMFYSRVSFAG
ncbi:MAG: hypothetical protein WCG21_11925 [Eubacteriales bacterium]